MRRPVVPVLLLLGLVACSKPATETAPPHETITLESQVMQETRRINVYLPPGYAAADPMRYPVIYMPDGGLQEDFPHLANTIDAAIAAGEMRPVILVGIENTERRRDVTGPTEVESDRQIAPRVGGSALFRAFIADELIPHIDARYRTTGEAGIIGESAAGLFIVETFFLQPELFDTWIALSPSLWWNNHELVDKAAERLAARPDLVGTLYLSSAEETDIVPHVARLGAILQESSPAGLVWYCEPRPDLLHSNIYRTVSPGVLRRMYPPEAASR